MLMNKQKKTQITNNNKRRLLISINVMGSAGPIRFVVNEEELVAAVIETTLKSYAREGRLPVLGSDNNAFCLYCPLLGSAVLSPWDKIGSHGARNFVLCKNPQATNEAADGGSGTTSLSRRGSGSWRAWFNKSLNLKVSSH
ncbi:uncharacterized protein At4g22758 [Cicer arietinum]|uniref:Uncharacterized protein At4g22758 n=1 Tax=Cicer arietinum TaxID=3827 RepID=A0A1S2Y2D7_CICAR|nr:uncharacterized protein At4g22758 [Cicer arietinum]